MPLYVLALIACGDPAPPVAAPAEPVGSTPSASPAEEPPAEEATPELEVTAALVSFTGTWSSDSCGERTYARQVELETGGSYTGMDLVSPCPPNARCAWSGVVTFAGSWRQDGAVVVLGENEVSEPATGAKARPERLHFDPLTTRLYEEDGEARCYYERGKAPRAQVPVVPRPK